MVSVTRRLAQEVGANRVDDKTKRPIIDAAVQRRLHEAKTGMLVVG
jgi:hypothetical protein